MCNKFSNLTPYPKVQKAFVVGLLLALIFSLLPISSASAQTATDPNEGLRVDYDSSTQNYLLKWWGRPGRTYFIQQSADLKNWSWETVIYSGNNVVLQWGSTSSAPKLFFRLVYSDIPTSDPANADFDGDGISNLTELQNGSDPTNYYSQSGTTLMTPTVAIVGGNNQTSLPGAFTPQPLIVQVTNSSGGTVLVNAPVTFTVTSGGGQVSATSGGGTSTSVQLTTNSSGQVQVYYQQPSGNIVTSTITATSGGQSVTFTENSVGPYSFITLAGLVGSGASTDGTGSAARFFGPEGGAVDTNGNFYVADYQSETIRKIAPGGVVTTLAGLSGSSGSTDGTGSAARFFGPGGVAVDAAGNVYVADIFNDTIRKITPGGVVTTLAGLAENSGSTDGTGSAARFNGPGGVAVDASGNVYVMDTNNLTVRKITPGGVVTTLAGSPGNSGSTDGTGSAARFNYSYGLGVDANGNVYVADMGNSTIRKITPGGVVSTLAGLAGNVGSVDGVGSAARFDWPSALAVDASGYIYVTDVRAQTIRRITPDGAVTTLAGIPFGTGSSDGTGSAAKFNSPFGIAVDAGKNLYVADRNNDTIRLGTPSSAAPVITSATSGSGTVGAPFSYTITAVNSPGTFSITGVLPGLNINTATGVISGTPSAAGVYTVTLGATNTFGTGTATLTLTINAALPAVPVITSGTTASGTAGAPFTYTIAASNTPTSFSASGLPSGLSINTSTGAITGTPTAAGISTVILGAANAGGSATPVSLTLTINSPALPVITSGTTASGDVGVGFNYTITASNNPTSFSASGLPTGLSLNTATGVISGTPASIGTSAVILGAANSGGSATAVTLTLTVNGVAVPVINSGLTASGLHGVAFSYRITASNNPMSFNASGLPAGLNVNTGTGIISGTPTSTSTSTVSATISAANSSGTGSATLIFSMNPPAPVISSSTAASGNAGSVFSYTITASNTPTSFSASGLPTGLSVDTNSGAITGTPLAAGASTVTINATNAGGTGTATLTLTIGFAEPVPVITSGTTASGDAGVAFNSYTITTSTQAAVSTTYGATGLPPGLTVNASTGAITGTPTTVGTWTAQLSATGIGGTGHATLTFTINPAGAPVISSATTAIGQVGSAFSSYTVIASNSPTSYSATGLPSGLSINTSTGAISGTATATATGASTVFLSATNSLGTGTATLVLIINPPTPVISSATTDSGALGVTISPYTITASSNPIVFGATGLPPGLNINIYTGVITGTPTVPGTWPAVISASNAGGTGSVTLTFTITAGGSSPIVTRSVANGNGYSLILKSDGTVWAAGFNGDGELGNGGNADSASYVQVTGFPAGTKIIAISAGYAYGMALTSTGAVWTWGFGLNGELGCGQYTQSNVPVQVQTSSGPLSGIISITGGNSFGMALDNGGNVWTWGLGYLGELGYGDNGFTWSDVAEKVSQTSGLTGVVAIAGGSDHALAVKSDGTVWAWGDNSHDGLGIENTSVSSSSMPVQVTSLSGIISVAAGTNYSIALKNDGTVWAWGDNSGGYLGNGFTGGDSAAPVTGMSTGPAQVLNLSGITSISGHGGDHTLALKNDGTVWAWGLNGFGQLGNGATTDSPVPVQVTNLTGVIALAAAYSQNTVLKSDGSIWGWGFNNSDSNIGATGPSTQAALPIPVSNLSGITAVAAARSHYLALKNDGTVWTWDDTTPGEVSDGITITGSSSAVQVPGLSGITITAVACGAYFNLALDNNGHVWAWGENNYGQLGNGTFTAYNQTPGQVSGLSGVTITAIACGSSFGMALDSGGHVWTWGYNADGELGNGNGSGTNTNTAAQIPSSSLSGITKISASRSRASALKTGGTVWTWGYNYAGELGTGTSNITNTNPTPVQITSLNGTTITAVTAGRVHSMVLDSTGHVWTWGVNTDGELGNNSITTNYTPTLVSSLSGITAIHIGPDSYHSVALKTDGTLWTWGCNTNGQLGRGVYGSIDGVSPTGSDAPVQVLGLNGVTVTGLACGKYSTVALTSSGTVLEWGDSFYEPVGFSAPTEVADLQAVPGPVISPRGGSYASSQFISITSTVTGTIHYTLDGTDPTANSPTYTGSAFTLSASALVSAGVFDAASGGLLTPIATTQFYINDTSGNGLPTLATGFSAVAASNTEIDLHWTLSGTVNYSLIGIYRSTLSGGVWSPYQLIALLDPSSSSYADTSVQVGSNYQYYVGTLNSSGESDTAHSTSVAPTLPATFTITLTTPTGSIPLP